MLKPDDAGLRAILAATRTIAVVGASANPQRDSNEVYSYLRATGRFQLYPVNPTISEIDGAAVYPSLSALPVIPDLVDVFRRADQLGAVLDDVLGLAERPKTLWLQLGLSDERVAHAASAAGLQVVMDRCLKVEHARLM